jgi:LPXTG-site transpeptidase (sortase) family protein
MLVISDVLVTLALIAFMYAGYQTVWTKYLGVKQSNIVKTQIEVQWKEAPNAAPALHKGFALVYIPRLRDKVWGLPLTEGVDPQDLESGLGHYPSTKMPGLEGNFAIAGHRSTYGEPLANIDQLQQDDEIYIKTGQNWYTYKLLMTAIVEPDEMWVIEDNPGGLVNSTGIKEMITITTCDPRWGSTHRWVWWGTLEKVALATDVPEAIGAVQ